jgi:hypothetical protein
MTAESGEMKVIGTVEERIVRRRRGPDQGADGIGDITECLVSRTEVADIVGDRYYGSRSKMRKESGCKIRNDDEPARFENSEEGVVFKGVLSDPKDVEEERPVDCQSAVRLEYTAPINFNPEVELL